MAKKIINDTAVQEPKDPVNIAVDLETEHLFHWQVDFEIKVDKGQIDSTDPEFAKEIEEYEDEPFIWVEDTLIVRGPDDAQIAIDKAKTYVLNKTEISDYELPCTEFSLSGVKLLSKADL